MKPSVPEEVPTGMARESRSARLGSPVWKSWAGLVTRFLSLEVLIQVTGFIGGVLLVRVLPKSEYAWLTIANTLQQTMNTLADNGISSGLTAIGGRVWNDRSRFGQLLRTGMRLRRVLALVTITLVVPILAWMLTEAGARPSQTALLCAVVLIGFYFQLGIGVLIVAPLLHLDANRVQRLNLWSAALRLVLLLGAYAIFLNAAVALLAAAASFAFQERLLRRWLGCYADPAAAPNAEDRRDILSIVRSQAPNAVYYCIQSQLTIVLISIFGSTSAVAEVGALGRIGMIFLALSSVLTNVVMPRFARVQQPQRLWRRYWQILGALCALLLALLAGAAAFPELLLWILGPKYAHLESELFLMVLGTVLASVLGTMYQLNLTRGWVVPPWLLIPMGVSTEVLLIVLLDLSHVRGVLLFAIYSTIPGFFLNLWRTRKGIHETAENVARAGHAPTDSSRD